MKLAASYFISGIFLFYLFSGEFFNVLLSGFIPEHKLASLVNQTVLFSCLTYTLFIAAFNHRKFIDVALSNFLMIVALSWLSFSYFWALYPEFTARRIIGEWLVLIFVISLATQLKTPINYFKPIFFVTLLIVFINLVWIIIFNSDSFAQDGYFKGIFFHKNHAGTMFSILSIIVLCSCAIYTRTFIRTAMLLITFIFCIVLMILAGSKTNYGLYAVVGILYILIFVMYKLKYFSLSALTITSVSVILAGWSVLFFMNVNLPDIFAALTGDPTLTGRTAIWAALLDLISQRPFLGIGWGSLWDVGENLNPLPTGYEPWIYNAKVIKSGHNTYIDIWAQAGFVSLLLVIFINLRCVWVCFCLLNSSNPRFDEKVIVFCNLFVMTFIIFNGLTESLLFRPSSGPGRLFIYMYVFNEFWWLAVRAENRRGSDRTKGATANQALA